MSNNQTPKEAPLKGDTHLPPLLDLQAIAAAQPLPDSPIDSNQTQPYQPPPKSPLQRVSLSAALDGPSTPNVPTSSPGQTQVKKQPSWHMPSKSPLSMTAKSPVGVPPLDFQSVTLTQPQPVSQHGQLPDWLGTPPPANVIFFPPLPPPNRPITPHPPTAHPLAYSVMQDQGSRAYMQDHFLVTDSLFGIKYTYLFGVFDGHGEHGDKVSMFLRDRMLSTFSAYADQFAADPVFAIIQAFQELDEELLGADELDVYGSGACAVVVIVTPERLLVTANIGDSRAVLCKMINRKDTFVPFKVPKIPKSVNGLTARRLTQDESGVETTDDEDARARDYEVIPLTSDHTLADDNERNRCIEAGGRVERVQGDEGTGQQNPLRLYKGSLPYPGIMVTRAFGDATAKKLGVTVLPEVRCQQIDDRDLCLVLGSDGLFDGLSNQRVIKTCFNVWKAWRKRRPDSVEWMTDLRGLRKVAHESSKRLLRKSWKEDNVTAMCVML